MEFVMNGNRQTVTNHQTHFTAEITAVIRPSLQHVELPLVNHFVGERADHFVFRLALKQRR